MSTASTSSESPERPVARMRGGRRGRQSAVRGGRARGGVRSRAGRGRGADFQAEAALGIVQSRKERMKSIITDMPEERMREILLDLCEVNPSLIFDIIEPVQRQPGGYHPPEGAAYPDWCVCGKCREMPTDQERMCCEREDCLTLLPDFQVYILDEGVLALARLYRQDILVFDEDVDVRKANRHAAYRQFVLWQHGRLGAGNRVVIPSCCVWGIRDKYPDAFGQYKGFIANRLA